MNGSYSIDPSTFIDDDGRSYMYFGGIWGGQLQQWESGEFDPKGSLTRVLTKPKLDFLKLHGSKMMVITLVLTGDTHNLAYATGDNPYGPFTYQGILGEPVQGWTNHHSTIKIVNNGTFLP